MPAFEKRYDQDESSASSEEDFVNASSATPVPSSRPGSAAGTARPSSRASRTSGGSRSSKRGKVHSSSSSESTDSEEEAELRDELANVDLEAGTVRGAPVGGHVERVMRSIAKGRHSGATTAQVYAAVDPRDSHRRKKSHRSSRRRSSRSYSLGTAPPVNATTYADPAALANTSKKRKAVSVASAEPPKGKSRLWIYLLCAIFVILVIAGVIIGFVVYSNQSDETTESRTANSTDASDNQKLESSASTTGSLLTDLPDLTDAKTSGTTTATGSDTFDNGKYRPTTTASLATASPSGLTEVLPTTDALAPTGSSSLTRTGTDGHVDSASTGSVRSATDSLNVVPQPTGTANVQTGVQAPSSQVFGNNSPQSTGATGSPTAWSPQENPQDQQQAPMWWSPQEQIHGPGQSQQSQHGPPPPQQSGSPPPPGAWYGGQSGGSPSWNGYQTQQGPPGGWQAPPAQQGQQGDWQQQKPAGGEGQGQGQQQGQYQNGQGVWPPHPAGAPLAPGPYMGSGAAPSSSPSSPSSSDSSPWGAAGAGAGVVAGGWPGQQQQQPQQVALQHPFANATAYEAQKPEPFQNFTGNGTWFESSQHFGACGYATEAKDFVVALSNQTWAASRESKAAAGAPSKFCGAEVLVTNAHTGTTINAWVTEHCAYCVGENALDLSKAVFEQLAAKTGGLDQGVMPIVWGFTGNVTSAQPHTGSGAPMQSPAEDEKQAEAGADEAGGWFDGWFGSGDDSDKAAE